MKKRVKTTETRGGSVDTTSKGRTKKGAWDEFNKGLKKKR